MGKGLEYVFVGIVASTFFWFMVSPQFSTTVAKQEQVQIQREQVQIMRERLELQREQVKLMKDMMNRHAP